MARKKALTVPAHALAMFVTECIALRLTGYEFARQRGLSRDQGARISKEIKLRAGATNRTTPSGSIIPSNSAQSLSRLSSRMINALLGQGQRAVEVLEIMNARYAPRPASADELASGSESMIAPEWCADDRQNAKWAREVCWRIITLNRKDGRDLPAGEGDDEGGPGPVSEPVERRPEGHQPHGALVIIDAATGAQVSISE